MYFAFERMDGSDNQEKRELEKLIKQEGIWESKGYSAMYKDRDLWKV